MRRAGLKPWPRLFHAMRASRETELAQEYPIHVVTAWLGNTPRIALKHYLTVTDADFEQATKGSAESSANVAQNRAQIWRKIERSSLSLYLVLTRKNRNKPLRNKGLCEVVRQMAK